MKKLFVSFFCFMMTTAVFAQKVPSHQQWDKLLKKHVSSSGMVNYKGFKNDKTEFDAYLKTLRDNAPQSSWSINDQKAFWINAYNAFTVSLILQNYPVKSIKDIGGKIYKVNTPWDIKFINIGREKYDLNNIEHKILRKFNDPLIHFAIVCASMSCAELRREAYIGSNLESQLNTQGKDFLNDKNKNNINANNSQLSKYFTWYKGDFAQNGSLVNFINKYSQTKISSRTKITYLDYNWSLNEQK
ncbi:MAG: DUF547 domain-containing protein [Daejeonella sp.]|uniref:DUF547 domain-containing protein n=1 Tax=Daejeonella sp. TaxID=2805397 RepID=UPI003C76BF54